MCVGCGNTCGDTPAAPSVPRFAAHASAVPMSAVGTAAGVTSAPTSLITTGNGLLTMQPLYSAPAPDNTQGLYTLPGSFGMWATKAGKGR